MTRQWKAVPRDTPNQGKVVDVKAPEVRPRSGQLVIIWLRNDLRLRDNALFHHPCARQAAAILPVYCFDPRHFGSNAPLHPRWSKGAADLRKTGVLRGRFLAESVAALRTALRSLSSDLVVTHGCPEEVIPALLRQFRSDAGATVLCQHEVAPEEEACEVAVRDALAPLGASLETCWGSQTLYDPEDLPFKMARLPEPFTYFRNAVENEKAPVAVPAELPAPSKLKSLPEGLSEGLRGLELELVELVDVGEVEGVLTRLGFSEEERSQRIDRRCLNKYVGGELAGLARLEDFVDKGLATYKQTRDGFLGANFSSKLSPWLAHGCVSARTIYWRVAQYEDQYGETLDTYWLTFELKWRDFFRFFAAKHGRSIFFLAGPARAAVSGWSQDAVLFDRWCRGETGVPFVDAHMRELRFTGFMSNRGRQCVASFLTQDLGIDWRLGAQWFEHGLLDHDVSSNYGNWVCAAGVGMRGQRLNKFNMAKQAQQYDPAAEFIKLWVPEVAKLPANLAMAPWSANREMLARAACRIPEDYPVAANRPSFSAEAKSREEERNRSEKAEVTAAGYPVAKRRWHRGRNGAFLAS